MTMTRDAKKSSPSRSESAKPIESGIDYVLPEDQQSVWITVGNISVYIKRNDEGVSVDLYPLDDAIAAVFLVLTSATGIAFDFVRDLNTLAKRSGYSGLPVSQSRHHVSSQISRFAASLVALRYPILAP
jgi:hypothetical protein